MTALIHIDREPGIKSPDDESFRCWVEAALNGAGYVASQTSSPEISLRINGSDEMANLNHTYRAKAGPTNVLSFPADIPDSVDCDLLGDIVICAPVVVREAEEQHKIGAHHWAHLTVHGVLHLLGFDHIDDHEAEQMEQLEITILKALGLPNPYVHHSTLTTA